MPVSASITALQEGLLAAIETAAAGGAFALPFNVQIADSAAAVPPAPEEPMDVQIAFKGSATLARSSTRVLEQALVDIDLTYRHPDSDQGNLDTCHLVAEQLRDLLCAFQADGSRVDQLIVAEPFDEDQAMQGVYSHKLTLDCDVLRLVHTQTAPEVDPDASPRLSAIRGAVWDSINNWTPLADVWTRKFQDSIDVEELALHDPGLADLPAIAVSWGNVGQNWWTHREQKWPASLNVVFWLPAHQIEIAEWRTQQIVQALYRASAAPGPNQVTYLKAATGYPPEKYTQVIEPVELGRGQNKALRGTIAFTLPASFQPYD